MENFFKNNEAQLSKAKKEFKENYKNDLGKIDLVKNDLGFIYYKNPKILSIQPKKNLLNKSDVAFMLLNMPNQQLWNETMLNGKKFHLHNFVTKTIYGEFVDDTYTKLLRSKLKRESQK